MKKGLLTVLVVIVSMTLGAGLMFFGMDRYTQRIKEELKNEQDAIIDNSIAEGIDRIFDAVVVIENYKNGKLAGTGSGFIYDAYGYVMTNHHVIANYDELFVILSNGEKVSAKLIGSDEYADIAVLKIDKKYATKIASLGSNESTKLGDTVFTIGSPMNSNYAGTVTRGILSGKDRIVEVSVKTKTTTDWAMNVMQTDAAINPGNSGGPLCDINGYVIGVNSMKIVLDEVEGIGFAIPIEDALEYANKITNGQEIKRPALGVQMADINTAKPYLAKKNLTLDESITYGVVVLDVFDNGPSLGSGIQVGDVIVKVNDYKIETPAKLRYYLAKFDLGETIDVVIKRGKEQLTFRITLK